MTSQTKTRRNKIIAVIGYCEDGKSANIFFDKAICNAPKRVPQYHYDGLDSKHPLYQLVRKEQGVIWHKVLPYSVHVKKGDIWAWHKIMRNIGEKIANHIGVDIEFKCCF